MQVITPDQVDSLVAGGLKDSLPGGAYVRQIFEGPEVSDIPAAVKEQLGRSAVAERIRPGMRIAVGVGSRGIKCLPEVVKSTVEALKSRGAAPFIVPAMGSHGGATPEGQRQVLAGYGITEEALGVPIETSMDVVELGTSPSGAPVYFSQVALAADGVIAVGRVKAHTSFRGPVESGLYKMLAIGFGKHRGAAAIHSYGFAHFEKLIPEVGQFLLDKAPVLFGVAIVENAAEDPALIEALLPEEIPAREPELLEKAKAWMGRILFEDFDALIVDEMGKDISGDGMDPNVTGRFSQPFMTGGPTIQKIAVLDLTEETHGNACGIGQADVTTQRVFDKLDFAQTYTNAITSTVLSVVRLPVVMPTAQSAAALAIRTCTGVTPQAARVVRIPNTLELDRIWISDALLEDAKGRGDMDVLEIAQLDMSC